MNHISNPIVRWILSSRLHGLMSKNVLLITFRGRKSGKHFTTPVQYIQTGQEIWIIVGYPEKKRWWKNLTESTLVNLCLRGEWQSGQAITLTGDENRAEIVRGLGLIKNQNPGLRDEYTQRTLPNADLSGFVLVKVLLD